MKNVSNDEFSVLKLFFQFFSFDVLLLAVAFGLLLLLLLLLSCVWPKKAPPRENSTNSSVAKFPNQPGAYRWVKGAIWIIITAAMWNETNQELQSAKGTGLYANELRHNDSDDRKKKKKKKKKKKEKTTSYYYDVIMITFTNRVRYAHAHVTTLVFRFRSSGLPFAGSHPSTQPATYLLLLLLLLLFLLFLLFLPQFDLILKWWSTLQWKTHWGSTGAAPAQWPTPSISNATGCCRLGPG